MTRNMFILAAAAACICALSCEKPSDDGEKDPVVEGKEITFSPDRKTNLRNPLCGWVLYCGIGNQDYNFWTKYENFSSSEGKVDVVSYSNTLLIRTSWTDLNPAEGVYAWQESCNTPVAKYYRWVRDEAFKRGMRVGFGYGIDSRDKSYSFTPDYVREKGAKGYYNSATSKLWSPYPDDPVFQQCYEKFLHDFAQEINDPEHYEWVHGVGIGKWGEYHNCIYSTGDETPKAAVVDWVSTAFTREFTKIPTFINYHRLIGSTASSGSPSADSEGLVDLCVKKGMSLGSGAFGMTDYFGAWEKGIAIKYKYKRPIAAEGGWIVGQHRYWTDGSGKYREGHPEDVRQGEYDDAIACSANNLDFRVGDETVSWFNDAFDLVKKFISEGTYRLYPQKVVVPQTAKAGSEIAVSHRWMNLGQAYCPTNIPQFEGKYKLAFALLDPATGKPVKMFYDEQAKPCDWHKGKPVNYTFKFRLDGVTPGKYVWGLGIVDDHSKDKKIGIYIAASGEYTADSWLKLTEVTIN